MIGKADIRRVQEWMGHADIQTTMKYLHYAPREEDADSSPRRFSCRAPQSLILWPATKSPASEPIVVWPWVGECAEYPPIPADLTAPKWVRRPHRQTTPPEPE